MADYHQILKQAIASLPDNNGANRRQVYEKARTALVGQLRDAEPPLSSSEITQHRLALEDCIREVEQQATQSLKDGMPSSLTTPHLDVDAEDAFASATIAAKPVLNFTENPSVGAAENAAVDDAINELVSGGQKAVAAVKQEPVIEPGGFADDALSDIIDGLVDDSSIPSKQVHTDEMGDDLIAAVSRAMDPPVNARGNASKSNSSVDAVIAEVERSIAPGPELIEAAPVKEDPQLAIDRAVAKLTQQKIEIAPDIVSDIATARDEVATKPVAPVDPEPVPMAAAVEVTPQLPPEQVQPAVAEVIAVGDVLHEPSIDSVTLGSGYVPGSGGYNNDAALAAPRKSSGALRTLFMVLALLLVIFAGVVYWAWSSGRGDLGGIFDRVSAWRASITQTILGTDADEPTTVATETPATSDTEVANPTSTDSSDAEIVLQNDAGTVPERQVRIAGSDDVNDAGDKSEERLPTNDGTGSAEEGTSASPGEGTPLAPISGDVSQSILLEEQPSGSTGGLPFSGNVVWDKIVDAAGVSAIRGRAKIPARNISLELVIRKNFDTQLPASHVMEINFVVQPTFAGGGVANVPGILMKNEELAQGKALVGASARVVDNSFLVALSQSEADLQYNLALMQGQAWIDVPMVYSTGKRAIITLEKGTDGTSVFAEIMAEWSVAN